MTIQARTDLLSTSTSFLTYAFFFFPLLHTFVDNIMLHLSLFELHLFLNGIGISSCFHRHEYSRPCCKMCDPFLESLLFWNNCYVYKVLQLVMKLSISGGYLFFENTSDNLLRHLSTIFNFNFMATLGTFCGIHRNLLNLIHNV